MIPHEAGKKISNQARDQIIEFRNAFLSKEGQNVWAFLHGQLGTWSSNPSPSAEEAALHAFGMRMLEWAGINHEVNEYALSNAFWKIPPSFETVNKIEDKRGS